MLNRQQERHAVIATGSQIRGHSQFLSGGGGFCP